MKITAVDAFLMSCPFADPLLLPFRNGERTILKRDAMYIRVTTDTGLRGYAPGPADERAYHVIRDEIRPFLDGRDPLQWRSFEFRGSAASAKVYAAVEIAVMDAAARYEGCALSEIVGGRVRPEIKLYGSAGMYMPPEGYAAEAAAVQAMGFPAYKMRPARGPNEDVETVARMREATGPGFGLMVDAHAWWRMGDQSYTFDMVASVAAALSVFDPVWLEEPLPPEDHDAYARLRARGLVKVATGEHEPDEAGFADLARRRAADVLQMDVCCQGGFAMGRRVVESARAAGARFAFHSWGTMLEVLAAAHFGVCWPADLVEWLEYPCYAHAGRPGMYPFPLADEILTHPLEIVNGHLRVPDGPGLGVEIDEAVVDKYPFIPGPWSFFEITSPPETIAVTGDHSLKWV
jgi:L-alanine-DL-glutamate epimerase-like enolase superfamily enzyme